jgi:hypothetical protein
VRLKHVTKNPILKARWDDCLNTVFEIHADCLEYGEPVKITIDYNGKKEHITVRVDSEGEAHWTIDETQEKKEFEECLRNWAYGCSDGRCLRSKCHRGDEYARGCRDAQLRMKMCSKEYIEEHEKKHHRVGWFK